MFELRAVPFLQETEPLRALVSARYLLRLQTFPRVWRRCISIVTKQYPLFVNARHDDALHEETLCEEEDHHWNR